MAEEASFSDFPVEIRKRAVSYLGMTSRGKAPEASNVGTEGSETSERSESSENSESTETTERKEAPERSVDLLCRGPR